MFAFFKCLLCANVYACVCDPVSITFYRLLDKSIFFTSIAAAASKRAELQWWESTANTSSRACALMGNHFLRAILCIFCSLWCKQVPVVTWPSTFLCAPQSSELISMHLQFYNLSVLFHLFYFYCFTPLSAIFGLNSQECKVLFTSSDIHILVSRYFMTLPLSFIFPVYVSHKLSTKLT